MPSYNTYHLTWVSLTLDEGYLLTAPLPDLQREIAPLGRTLYAIAAARTLHTVCYWRSVEK